MTDGKIQLENRPLAHTQHRHLFPPILCNSLSHPTHLGQFNGQKTKLQGGEGHWRLKYVNGNDLDHAFCGERADWLVKP